MIKYIENTIQFILNLYRPSLSIPQLNLNRILYFIVHLLYVVQQAQTFAMGTQNM